MIASLFSADEALGMVCHSTLDVIDACCQTLNRIYKYRSNHRREYICASMVGVCN